MKVYKLEAVQILPLTLEEAWDFFSTPKNLEKITPKELDFKILPDFKDEKMYPGQIINYIVKPVLGIPMRWTTEITQVINAQYFVDEQRFGPYAFWHHKHFFKSVDNGVEMTDIVHYAIPFGIFGTLAHVLFVKNKLNSIFSFRKQTLEDYFSKS